MSARCARPAAALVAALALVSAASAGPAPVASKAAPTGLKAFLTRADERAGHTFSRTPSFAWAPVRGAKSYELELATSRRFTESSIVWSSQTLKTPVASLPVVLPWITGSPYSLYAHVRAITAKGPSAWSSSYGFNMRWPAVPAPLPTYPGLVRWTPVEGATGYNVWFVDAGKVFSTVTNIADEREYYSFHQDPAWTGTVHWRVRAVRTLYGTIPNGMPAVSYGPWSPFYTSTNPSFASGRLTPVAATSDVTSDAIGPKAHELTPAFVYSGNQSFGGLQTPLYRVYVFSDRDCVNVVFRGAIVGGPAYAPRTTGPLALPKDSAGLGLAQTGFLLDGSEGASTMADGIAVSATESGAGDPAASSGSGSGSDSGTPSSGGSATSNEQAGSGTSIPSSQTATGAKVDLWDNDWPTGRYYWTVVPVDGPTAFGYHDLELPQDVCAAGRVSTFGKLSKPVVTGSSVPYVSGLSSGGRLTAATHAKPSFFGAPLVAWQPALGAGAYEVQWSRTAYPWKLAGQRYTYGTSLMLPLGPGTWYYRVRGIDYHLPGSKPQLSWSAPVPLVVARPRFRVVSG